MKSVVLAIVCLFLIFGGLREDLYATSSLQDGIISNSIFQKLGVELKENVATTYFVGDAILIQGRVINKKEHVLFFMKNIKTGKETTILFRTSTNGDFQIPVSLPNIEGKYYIVISSGNAFEITDIPEVITLVPKQMSSNSGKVTRMNNPNIVYGDAPYITFGDNKWANMILDQGGKKYMYWGKIFRFTDQSMKVGSAKIYIEGYPLLTPSSLNQASSLGFSWTGNIFIDRVRENIGKNLVQLKIRKSVGTLQFRLKKGEQIRTKYYITTPDGNVLERHFPELYIDTNGFLRTDILIQQNFPVPDSGVYKIETVRSNGLAYFNLPISKSQFWSIIDPISKEQLSTLRTDLFAIQLSTLRSINKIRTGLGRTPVVLDSVLSDLAQKKATDMAIYNYVGHVSHNGMNIVDFAKFSGINISGSIGENVAGGNVSDLSLEDGLEESGSHRSSMIREQFTKVGIGYVLKDGKTYLVQVFGE